jgi:5,5'-dehydrodivanillate O-demethylase
MTMSQDSIDTGQSPKARSNYRDFAHIGPGTLAGRYLRTFWQPVFRSEDLPRGKAKPLRILGEDFTLYRGESGKAYLVGDRCPHRGAKLSVGWVEQECIRCFYHGWMFNADGGCVEQPAEPKPFTDRVGIETRPIVEYLGLIFGFFGEGTPPPAPRFANFENTNALLVTEIDYRAYNFFQDFENGMDRVHGGFVHRSLPGSFDGRTDSPTVTAEEDEWGIRTTASHPSGRVGVQSFGIPNKQRIAFSFGEGELLTYKVPVDDENTAHFRITMYQGEESIARYRKSVEERQGRPQLDAFELAKEVVAGRLYHDDVDPLSTNMVWFQDNIVLLAQGVIADREDEFLGASDSPVVLLRRIWEREMRKLDEGLPLKEWRYDPNSSLKKV